jgi:hypothetical protein
MDRLGVEGLEMHMLATVWNSHITKEHYDGTLKTAEGIHNHLESGNSIQRDLSIPARKLIRNIFPQKTLDTDPPHKKSRQSRQSMYNIQSTHQQYSYSQSCPQDSLYFRLHHITR